MTTDEVLRCEDCGREFFRPSAKGMPPRRCRDCALEARNEAARRAKQKRRALRQRVVEKQMGVKKFCARCGVEIIALRNRKYCTDCSAAADKALHHNRYVLRRVASGVVPWEVRRRRELEENQEAAEFMRQLAQKQRWRKQLSKEAREAAKKFDKLCEAADEAEMTYGQYQAMLRRQRLKQGGEG